MTPPGLAYELDEWTEETNGRGWIVGEEKHQILKSYLASYEHHFDLWRERRGEPEARFTLADLVALLDALPRVDNGFLDEIEALNEGQPKLSSIKWGP